MGFPKSSVQLFRFGTDKLFIRLLLFLYFQSTRSPRLWPSAKYQKVWNGFGGKIRHSPLSPSSTRAFPAHQMQLRRSEATEELLAINPVTDRWATPPSALQRTKAASFSSFFFFLFCWLRILAISMDWLLLAVQFLLPLHGIGNLEIANAAATLAHTYSCRAAIPTQCSCFCCCCCNCCCCCCNWGLPRRSTRSPPRGHNSYRKPIEKFSFWQYASVASWHWQWLWRGRWRCHWHWHFRDPSPSSDSCHDLQSVFFNAIYIILFCSIQEWMCGMLSYIRQNSYWKISCRLTYSNFKYSFVKSHWKCGNNFNLNDLKCDTWKCLFEIRILEWVHKMLTDTF